jgi:Zn-finger nucleic acid-binding protein
MRCKVCGAPMDLVQNRDYFTCRYCLAFHFPDTKPVTNDEVRLLGAGKTKVRCPVCAPAKLVPASIDRQPVLFCDTCRGVLVTTGVLSTIVEIRRKRRRRVRVDPAPIDPEELKRAVFCPRCRKRMDTSPYLGPGNMVIDACGECCLVWLDHGEIGTIERHPG